MEIVFSENNNGYQLVNQQYSIKEIINLKLKSVLQTRKPHFIILSSLDVSVSSFFKKIIVYLKFINNILITLLSNYITMELINNYRILKNLGRGPFGKVFLTEKQGKKYAIKQIPRQSINQNRKFQQYIDEQLQCMMKINSPYIMKVKEKQQDQLNIYLIFQYCDGGNLIAYQSKLENQVFTLKKALRAISQIIMGLMELHSYQLLYKDIKLQNILVEVKSNNLEIFKLADFGFEGSQTLRKRMLNGSVNFLAPERLAEQSFSTQLGFAVDIWSIGVLLYFMLNMEYPFKLRDNQSENLGIISRKCDPIFSYGDSIMNTSRKLSNNATEEVQELFGSIFKINPQERITFHEIKQNSLLKEFFKDNQVIQKSKLIYRKEFESKIKSKIQSRIKKHNMDYNWQPQKNIPSLQQKYLNPIKEQPPNKIDEQFEEQQQMLPGSILNPISLVPIKSRNFKEPQSTDLKAVYQPERVYSIISSKIESEKYEQELKVYTFQKEKNELLLSISESYLEQIKYFILPLKYSLRYYSLKLYIIYTRNLKKFYEQKKVPSDRPDLNWAGFFKSDDYEALVRQVSEKLKQEEIKFEMFHKQCQLRLELIESKIKTFQKGFSEKIIQTEFEGVFKQSYRSITSLSYSIISKLLKNKQKLININMKGEIEKLYFMMINIFICHCFNRIFIKSELNSTFPIYFEWLSKRKLENTKEFSFDTFKQWLKQQNRENLQKTTEAIINKYFK